jgi:hypothetical protein
MDGRSLLDESWGRKRLLSEHWCNVDRCLFWSAYTSKKDQFTNWYTDASKGHVAFREYYDLEADPWQLVNRLHTAHPDNNLDVAALEAKLLSLQSCSGPSCWAAEDAPLS